MKLLLALGLFLSALYAAPVRPRQGTKPVVIVPHGPRRPTSRSEAAEQAKLGHTGSKTTVRRVYMKRMVHGRLVTVSRVVRVKTVPVVPPHPDADRLREIQKALADKGYFKGEVNGVWNADSVDALKQFQTQQNLTADGKISALSLIGLGLGPKHDGTVASLPSEKPQQNIPQ
jgi:hypothetical protein